MLTSTAWDVQKILPMTQHTYNEWVADIDAAHLEGSHLEFKFVAFRNAKNELLWETSMNRTVDLPEMKAGELVSYELDQAFFALAVIWSLSSWLSEMQRTSFSGKPA